MQGVGVALGLAVPQDLGEWATSRTCRRIPPREHPGSAVPLESLGWPLPPLAWVSSAQWQRCRSL